MNLTTRWFGPLLALFLVLPAFAQDEAEEVERGLKVNAPGALQGYTLFAPLLSKNVYLVDMEGEVVHTWETDHANSWSYLLDNGNLLYSGREEDNPMFFGGGIAGRIREYDWDGNLLWDYVLADEFQTQHHDIEPLPNGNILMIVWEYRFKEDAVAMGRDANTMGDEKGLWPDAIIEIEPIRPDGGEVVWEWHAWDHLIQDHDDSREVYGSPAGRPEKIDVNVDHRDQVPETEEQRQEREELEKQMRALGYIGGDEEEDDTPSADGQQHSPDWMHTNGVDYHPELDLIVISTPELNEIMIIDHSVSTDEAMFDYGGRWDRGGDILWRWGNPKNYGAGDESDQQLFYQHDPTFVPGATPDELRLLVFNNNGDGESEYSSVLELVLPFDPEKGFLRAEGEAFGPEEPIWRYEKPGEFFSSFISGCERLSNGNTLICSGAPGRIFEVTPAGEIVWDYLNPFGGEISTGQGGNAPPTSLFRAKRIPADHPALTGREL